MVIGTEVIRPNVPKSRGGVGKRKKSFSSYLARTVLARIVGEEIEENS